MKQSKTPIQALQIAQNAVEQVIQKQNLESYAQEYFGTGEGSKLEQIFADIHKKAMSEFPEEVKTKLLVIDVEELAFRHKQLIIELIKAPKAAINLSNTVNNFNAEAGERLDENLMNIINLRPVNELPEIPDEEEPARVRPARRDSSEAPKKGKKKSKSVSRKK